MKGTPASLDTLRYRGSVSAYTEALALQHSLPMTGPVPWEIGRIYNALLVAAKREAPDSISLAVLEPLTRNTMGSVSGVTAESLRTILAVVAAALEPPQALG